MLFHSVNELIGNTPLLEIKGFDVPQGTKSLLH